MSQTTVSWRALLDSGDSRDDIELIDRLDRLELWAKAQIEEARQHVRPRAPTIVVNRMLDEFDVKNRTAYLVQMRVLNHVLRRLNGETPTMGCGECTVDDPCFCGAAECMKRETP